MIHGPYADSMRRPLLPSLDHLFISNILEGKEGNQLTRARLIVFPFLRLSIPSISNSLVCSRSIEKIFRPYILRI